MYHKAKQSHWPEKGTAIFTKIPLATTIPKDQTRTPMKNKNKIINRKIMQTYPYCTKFSIKSSKPINEMIALQSSNLTNKKIDNAPKFKTSLSL
jgi:hypothetical protein